MTTQKSSAASFIDQINAEYAEVVKAEGDALPHAIRCGEFLTLAKENLKEEGGKWKDWLETNCPEIHQTTASLYMRLAKNKKLVTKAKSIRDANKLLPKQAARGSASNKSDAEEPAGGFDPSNDKSSSVAVENHKLADLEVDELCTMLIAEWEDDALRELAKRITDYLTKKSAAPRAEINNGVINPAPPSPSVGVRRA